MGRSTIPSSNNWLAADVCGPQRHLAVQATGWPLYQVCQGTSPTASETGCSRAWSGKGAITSASTTARVVNAALIMTICRLQRFTLCSDDGFAAAACMGTGYRGGCCQRSHHFDNGRGLDKGTGTTMDVISSTLMIGWPQAQAQTAVILPATLVAAVLPQCHNNWLDTVPLHHANNGRWTSNIIMEMIMEISLRSSWI